MADGDGDGGGEGGGSAEWQPIYDRVQAQAEALAADRARLEAASKVQRESWEAARRLQRSVEELQAAAREKDAEVGRLRAEAADATKKLQEVREADAGRRMRWEAAYVDLILGANQKLAELRDVDMEDSRICAETPNSKARLSQNTVDQACVASDLSTELRKLKQAYETLSSKKDQEVSALFSEKELARNQLVVMQKAYDALLRNKNGEAAQTTEAAQKLQRSVDDLKVSAQKKDEEISRLRAEAVAAEKKLLIAQKLQQSVDDLKAAAQKKDDEIDRLRAEAVAAEKKLREMQSLVQEKDDEIQTINDGQDETNQKRRRVSSTSNDDEQSESVEDDDVQSGSDEDGDEQSESDEQSRSDDNCDEQSRSDDDDLQSRSNNQVQKPLLKPKRKRDACNAQVANSNNQSKICQSIPRKHYLNRMAPKPLRSRKLCIVNGKRCLEGTGHWGNYVRLVNDSLADQPDKHKEFVNFLRIFRTYRIRYSASAMEKALEGHPQLIRQFNQFLPNNCQITVKEEGGSTPMSSRENISAVAGLVKLKEGGSPRV
ncbi:GRIP1-associated protein 1 [Triticum aestivum]|nr:GRIP1-associated protein 1-like [Triticum aestivum]